MYVYVYLVLLIFSFFLFFEGGGLRGCYSMTFIPCKTVCMHLFDCPLTKLYTWIDCEIQKVKQNINRSALSLTRNTWKI